MIALNIVLLALNVMLLAEVGSRGRTAGLQSSPEAAPPFDSRFPPDKPPVEPAGLPIDQSGRDPGKPPGDRRMRETNEMFPVFLEICMNVLEREIDKTGKQPATTIPLRDEVKQAGLSGAESEEGKKMTERLKRLYEEMELEFPEVYGK